MEGDPVEVGVDLVGHFEDEAVALAEVMDRLETVTSDPRVQREILETAERRGLIEREEGLIRPRAGDGVFVRFESQVTTKEGEFTCRRCGAELGTGFFIQFDAGELGPFGSSCIRKVTGRDA